MLGFDGRTRRLEAEADAREADVIVDTTTDAWLRFLGTPPSERDVHQQGVQIQGTPDEIAHFAALLARFPDAADQPRPPTTVTPVV